MIALGDNGLAGSANMHVDRNANALGHIGLDWLHTRDFLALMQIVQRMDAAAESELLQKTTRLSDVLASAYFCNWSAALLMALNTAVLDRVAPAMRSTSSSCKGISLPMN